VHGREHGYHGVIDPCVDTAERFFRCPGSRFDILRLRNISFDDEGFATQGLDLGPGRLESVPASSDECDPRAMLREFPRRRPPHSG
jgi:hypothetical protein